LSLTEEAIPIQIYYDTLLFYACYLYPATSLSFSSGILYYHSLSLISPFLCPSLERNMIAPPLHLPRSNFNSVSHRYLLDIPSALSTAPANPSTSPNRTLFNPRSPSSLPPLTHAFLDNGRTLICVHPLNNLSTFSSGVGSEEEEEEEGGVRQRTQIAS